MIKISNLSKEFSGVKVLNGLNLDIQTGDVVALIGSSGAGKSTFLRSVNYLEKPDSGLLAMDDFKVDFETITKEQILTLRRKTAMVFQQFNLFGRLTALENVMEGLVQVKKMSKAEAAALAQAELIKVGLAPVPGDPHDTTADRSHYYPKFLSGGQQQRVGIARALAMKPELLLLDEPTSALDPELVGEVQDSILAAAKGGQTMLLVSHEMDFVYHVATKVLFLENGKILEAGTPDEIFNQSANSRIREFLSRHNARF